MQSTRHRLPGHRLDMQLIRHGSGVVERQWRVVVLRRNGATNLTEFAKILGYSSHSEVSKRLARIRDYVCPFLRQEPVS